MCGRFALKATPVELATSFGLDQCAEFGPRYNIAPGTDIAVVRRAPDGKRVLGLLRWGLVPNRTRDPAKLPMLNNARGESLADKPSFREAYLRRRCLVPASGFYEWSGAGGAKQAHYITLKSGQPMALAGLWESWTAPDGSILRSVCIVTTGPNSLMKPIHERMPVIIAAMHWSDWLAAPVETIVPLLAAYPADEMHAWPVSNRVNKTAEDDAGLVEPMSA
ncbi:MAG: SOS response-associated peptidase [Proteobacteria bacterium]|nr:SOS response-associated peptidase [Pseudomonadota bacterium]